MRYLVALGDEGSVTGCKNKPSLSAELARDRRRGDRLAAIAHSRSWHAARRRGRTAARGEGAAGWLPPRRRAHDATVGRTVTLAKCAG